MNRFNRFIKNMIVNSYSNLQLEIFKAVKMYTDHKFKKKIFKK